MKQNGPENTPLVIHSNELQSYTPNISNVADSVIVDTISNEPNTSQTRKTIDTNIDELPSHYKTIIDGPRLKSPHLISWCLTIILLICFVLLIWFLIHYERWWYIFLILFIIFWCIYTLEWMCSSSMSYLLNIHDKQFVYNDIKRLHSLKPMIRWTSISYHYEVKTYHDSHGLKKTKDVKKTTHTAHTNYQFTHWRDISVPFTGLEQWKLIKLRLYKDFCFDNEDSLRRYNQKKYEWLRENNKDTSQEFKYVMVLDGFKERTLVKSSSDLRSKYLKFTHFFVILSCFGCSACYRCFFSAQTRKKTYIIQKEIGI